MVIVGSDVESLYPSLDALMVADIVFKESEVKFEGICYQEAVRYIALNSSEQECKMSALRGVLPKRRKLGGTRPGVTGE